MKVGSYVKIKSASSTTTYKVDIIVRESGLKMVATLLFLKKICTKDINTICNKVNKDRFWKK